MIDDVAGRAFAGELVQLQGLPAVAEFVAAARAFVEDRLPDPTRVHERLDADELATTAAGLRRAFRAEPVLLDGYARVLVALGLDPDRTFGDRLHLRILPPVALGASARAVGAAQRPITGTRWHRDTWGSGVRAQLNWWLPLWPITAQRTLEFLPAYWDRELANTSPAWDVTRLRDPAARATMPTIPEATEPIDDAAPLRPVPAVGDLLVFSGAQLHGTVPNTTDRTRLSVETRTVHLDDLDAGRGAPAGDSRPPHVAWHWFGGMTDGRSLADVVAPPR